MLTIVLLFSVLIAPTRGSNVGSSATVHGPAGSSSPLRGAATLAAQPRSTGRPGPHRPYEGQQPSERTQPMETSMSPHRPYEGQQPSRPRRSTTYRSPVLIAPTRGSNCSHPTPPAGTTSVLIAPTRGSNTGASAGRSTASTVLIAPTRGSNATAATVSPSSSPRPHRPYEGQQREPQHQRGERCGSSSPLRGAATPSRRRPPASRHVLIAPTRGGNHAVRTPPRGYRATGRPRKPGPGAGAGWADGAGAGVSGGRSVLPVRPRRSGRGGCGRSGRRRGRRCARRRGR